jgi:hypothetical protein
MRTRLLALAIGLALSSSGAAAQTYDCRRAEGKIRIDGRLDETSWSKALPLGPLRDIRGEDYPAPVKQTEVKLLWDEEYLYVGAFLWEDDVRAAQTEHDSVVWKDNDFEIFIDPDADGLNYYEFEINALGTVLDLIMDKGYSFGGSFYCHWDCPGLKTAVKVYGSLNKEGSPDRGWSCEWAIPRKALMRGFDEADKFPSWKMNFSRVEYLYGSDSPEENWVWAPTGVVDIHRPARWGTVNFKRP